MSGYIKSPDNSHDQIFLHILIDGGRSSGFILHGTFSNLILPELGLFLDYLGSTLRIRIYASNKSQQEIFFSNFTNNGEHLMLWIWNRSNHLFVPLNVRSYSFLSRNLVWRIRSFTGNQRQPIYRMHQKQDQQ